MAQPSTLQRFLAAIRAQESGGDYAIDQAGCLGAYCWNNQASWDSMAAAAGQHQYVGQNPATLPPQVQDLVASDNLARAYHSAGGSLLRAAEWWNGGATTSVPNPGLPPQQWAPQCGGGSSQAYACQVMMRMQLGGHYLAGSGGPTSPAGSGSGGVVTTAAHVSKTDDCLISFPGIPGSNLFLQATSLLWSAIGQSGNIGATCILTKSRGRAVVGAVMLGGGVLIALPGVFLIFAAIGQKVSGPLGKAAEATGAMVALVPGLEGAGVATAVAGRSVSRSAQQTQQRRQAKRSARKAKRQPKAAETTEASDDGGGQADEAA